MLGRESLREAKAFGLTGRWVAVDPAVSESVETGEIVNRCSETSLTVFRVREVGGKFKG